jgi:hypothetical protein
MNDVILGSLCQWFNSLQATALGTTLRLRLISIPIALSHYILGSIYGCLKFGLVPYSSKIGVIFRRSF